MTILAKVSQIYSKKVNFYKILEPILDMELKFCYHPAMNFFATNID